MYEVLYGGDQVASRQYSVDITQQKRKSEEHLGVMGWGGGEAPPTLMDPHQDQILF